MSDALTINNDDRLEQIAVEIETIQGVALLKVGERLLEAQELFKYDRSEGGFTGWVDARLSFSQKTAYRMIEVFKTFGSVKDCHIDRLSKSVLYALAAPENKSISEEALAQIKSGKPLTNDDVAALKEKLKAAKAKAAEHKQQFEIERNSSEDVRAALRSSTNEALFLKQSIEHLKAEIERLKQDNVIHVYPPEADPQPAVQSADPVAFVRPAASAPTSGSPAHSIARIINDNLHADTAARIADWLDDLSGHEVAEAIRAVANEDAA